MSQLNQSSNSDSSSLDDEGNQSQSLNFPLLMLAIKQSLALFSALLDQQLPARWLFQEAVIKLQKARAVVLKAMAAPPGPAGFERSLMQRLKAQIQTQRKSNEQRSSTLKNQNLSLLQKINTLNEQLNVLRAASSEENSLLQQKQFLLDRRLEESSVMLAQIEQEKTQLISFCDRLKHSDSNDRMVAEVLGNKVQQPSQQIIRSSLRLARAVAKLSGKQGSFKSKLQQGWKTIKSFMRIQAC